MLDFEILLHLLEITKVTVWELKIFFKASLVIIDKPKASGRY